MYGDTLRSIPLSYRKQEAVAEGGRNCIGGMQFVQNTEVIPDTNGRTVAHMMCFKCNKNGHYSDFCPNKVEGDQMHINAYKLANIDANHGNDDNMQRDTVETHTCDMEDKEDDETSESVNE